MAGVLQKEVTDLEFGLMHSALGSHHQSEDWIATMQGTFTVQGRVYPHKYRRKRCRRRL